MGLSDVEVRRAKPRQKPYKIADGKGLYVLVSPNGSKYWRLKYKYCGVEKKLALGVYPEVSLKEARDKRDAAKRELLDGKDPSQTRKVEKLTRFVNSENDFKSIALDWHEHHKAKWAPKHSARILRNLETDILPKIGSRPIKEITAPEMLAVIRSIEARGALEMAHRARAFCSQIFRFAIATGKAERNIADDLKGSLKIKNPKPHNRLEESELPEFLGKLARYDGDLQTQLALKLLLYTFVRTIELRGATWDEIAFGKAQWTIPASRMKMKQKHIVPLSRQALAVLEQLKSTNHNREHIFPNRNKPTTFISENTLLYAIYRMGYHNRATSHGFRATASTILNESLKFNSDAIERQLAHGERNAVRAAYNYAEYLPERTTMMQWWADFIDQCASK